MIEIILWGLSVVMALALAYILQFSASTRAFGLELSDTNSRTGFQDAVTPPWQTKIAILTYLGSFAVVVAMWSQFGWLLGVGSIAVIWFGAALATKLLPEANSNHYRNLIRHSMVNRYANFVKSGDVVRAEAMKHLLVKAGFDPDKLGSG